MKRFARGIIACGTLSAAPALLHGAASAEYDPYEISRERFHADVTTIAMEPVSVPLDIPDAEQWKRRLDEAVEASVRRLGIEVVSGDEWRERWIGYSERLGGIYDSSSGAADLERRRLVLDFTLRDLASALGVDATLTASIFWRTMRPGWDIRGWRGIDGYLTWKGEMIPHAQGARFVPQQVDALWIGISVRDRSRAKLYDIGCPVDWMRVYLLKSFDERPIEAVLTDKTFERALENCISPLNPNPPPKAKTLRGRAKR